MPAARAGSREALGKVLEAARQYLVSIARQELDPDLRAKNSPSDLVQETFVEAQRDFGQFQGATDAELLAWLRQIVIRTAGHARRDHLDAGKRDLAREQPTETLAELADSASTPSAEAMRHEQAARLAAALARLPEDMQHVLLGRHVDGLSHAAIAEQLGRTPAAVRVRSGVTAPRR